MVIANIVITQYTNHKTHLHTDGKRLAISQRRWMSLSHKSLKSLTNHRSRLLLEPQMHTEPMAN